MAILSKEGVEAIFNGTKTIESRFSKNRIAPFGLIQRGDLVYLKVSGGEVVGQFSVKAVISFEGLSKDDWQLIIEKYWSKISLGSNASDQIFLEAHQKSIFGTLIFIDKLERFITSPIKFKKSDQRGWMVLETKLSGERN